MYKNNIKLPILYSFRRCPFAIRARAALYYSGKKFIIREVQLSNKPKEMLDASSKGTVPVLVLGNQIIDESIEIILWCLKNNDELNLLKPLRKDSRMTYEYIKKIDTEFKFNLDRYKYSYRFKDSASFLGKFKHRAIALNYLIEINNKLIKESSLYLFENRLSLLDLCIFPLVRQYRIADIDWFDSNSDITKVKLWLDNILNLRFFKRIMEKNKPWKNTDTPLFFCKTL